VFSVFTAPTTATEPAVELLAETSLAGDLEVDGTLVGGLSGLAYDAGCDLFYAISDDRGSIDPPRFYTLKVRFDNDSGEVTVLGATLLRSSDGAPFTRGELDPEALGLHPSGSLFVASEGVPHRRILPLVARFGIDGSIRETVALPEHYLPGDDGGRGVRDNLGFEGLAISPDGSRLFAATENALIQDGAMADLDQGSPARLLVIELPSGRPIAEHLYEVGPVPDIPRPAGAFRTNGISEIVALDNHRLFVVERSFSAGVGNQVRIYLVDLVGASDIGDIDSLQKTVAPPPVPVTKSLAADLAELGIEPDNIEGAALGPVLDDGRRLMVLVADNNFQPSVQSNQLLFLAVSGMVPPRSVRPRAKVREIQGAAHVSPLVGRCVDGVGGVVTAVLGRRGGQAFWIQDPVGDADPSTSEGLFVTAVDGLPSVAIGDRVHLGGRVEEPAWDMELPVTRLFATSVEVEDRGLSAPRPVIIGEGGVEILQPEIASARFETFDPGRYAADAFESLEGMLVRVEDAVVVGPTSRHGEIVVLSDRGEGAARRTTSGGIRLLEDNVNPQRVVIDDRLVAEPPDLRIGDSLAGPVDGVLHYSFGSYTVLNTRALPDFLRGGLEPQRTSLIGDNSRLTVATFNLENLSAVSEPEKFARLAAIVVFNLASPDIVAVQEVQDDTGAEDDGTVTATRTLRMLVEAIAGLGGPRYETRSVDPEDKTSGGQPGANIRNAYLFNPARVSFVDRYDCADDFSTQVGEGPSLTCSPGLVDPGNPAFRAREDGNGGARKPLAAEFRFAGERLFLINLHLVSKGGDDPIFGRRQPRIETTSGLRTEQAQVVADFVRALTAIDASARVVVLGDLNDFEKTEPLRALEAVGLEDLIERLPVNDRYSYVYLGNSQVLDHVLATRTLADRAEIEMVHVNAEFPAAERASDHDPVIVRLAVGR
jgi:predicted extracellular nuclease